MRLPWIPMVLLFGTYAGLLGACSSDEVTFGGPLDLQISSNSPVSVGDSLQLDYDVVGRNLLGMVVEWGDAELDSVFFPVLSPPKAGYATSTVARARSR